MTPENIGTVRKILRDIEAEIREIIEFVIL